MILKRLICSMVKQIKCLHRNKVNQLPLMNQKLKLGEVQSLDKSLNKLNKIAMSLLGIQLSKLQQQLLLLRKIILVRILVKQAKGIILMMMLSQRNKRINQQGMNLVIVSKIVVELKQNKINKIKLSHNQGLRPQLMLIMKINLSFNNLGKLLSKLRS